MFRLLFVMVTTVLLGIGSGYFLWGSRVARLTESLSGLTLELDTMRARLAAPASAQPEEGGTRAADELRVINESIAAFRQELADQKALIESTANAATPPDTAAVNAQLRTTRTELAACIADNQDLEVRCSGAQVQAAPTYAPPPPPPAYAPPPVPPRPKAPAAAVPPDASAPGRDLSDPRF
ncbi:MAG: hypothetical protein ABR538_17750 [Candidatus Binatia bacterium]